MNIWCNAGNSRTNLQGDLRGYGTVWYNPKSIANILSLSNVKKKNRVTYDSESDGKFIVIKPDRSCREFKPSGSGLFFLETNEGDGTGTMLINTVEDVRFPRASALLWRTLEEWIVDHYVTQYNQRLDEWMNAHTRQ